MIGYASFSAPGYMLDIPFCRLGLWLLRAYPKSPDALNVIHAHAKCNNAR